jgi:hypothetical protein
MVMSRSSASPAKAAVVVHSRRSLWSSWRALLPLLLLPHLALAAYLGNRLVVYPDQDAYLSAAHNLLAGRGLSIPFEALAGFVRAGEPTSYYGIGAPLLYAAEIAVFGDPYFWLRLCNILLFAASLFFFRGICLGWMAGQKNDKWANWATAVVALSPFYIIFNQLFLTEMPFLCCELGTFYFLFKFLRERRTRDLLLSGMFFAFSLLVRANLLLFLPVVLIFLAARRQWKPALIYVFVVVLLVSPYCVRNSRNSHALFLFDGKAALNLWQFNSDVHQGGFWTEDFEHAPPMPRFDGMTEKQRSDVLMHAGMEWVRQHPARFLRFSVMRVLRFLSPLPHKSENRRLSLLLSPYSALIIAGFLIGAFSLSWRNPEHLLVLLLFFYTLAIDAVFMSATRHRILYDPFFVLVTFYWLQRRWGAEDKRQAPLAQHEVDLRLAGFSEHQQDAVRAAAKIHS